ncbi:3-methyl-2-oxobutanoate hydroxymethyltransferase [Cerasibacillus terrae]|uniref:3-methyl-2-oxobutanoate hydroxymethyltransferase n=1 Tax=Cerasibacillus terrae TaxID=2498845 RepID=A0A5C8NRQ2_9BACI|nr:3-methyl-2-oxobutanoate hydroxymethyltransferase [Cerasibacillus terrae]TXL63690.1 3-methyl-2-oxobutanoate hydroxymethyltransferase [Cerasibacillus terrae]
MKKTVATFQEMKDKNEKITMVTSYDYSMAKLVDGAGIDGILVGDSLGMVTLGYEDTLSVTMDDMVHHTKAVSRGVKDAFIVADMPFLSYHLNTEETIKNAGRLIQEGHAHAVKLEGGMDILDHVKAIVKAQIPVMGHIGLTPQSVNVFGGFKVQGKSKEKIQQLIDDAKVLEDAGVFAIVIEGIPGEVARIITEEVSIPTIGIGAGKYCDGQILVVNDMLGMFSDFVPKFVKQYKNLKVDIHEAFENYITEVKAGTFPEEQHTFKINKEIIDEFK